MKSTSIITLAVALVFTSMTNALPIVEAPVVTTQPDTGEAGLYTIQSDPTGQLRICVTVDPGVVLDPAATYGWSFGTYRWNGFVNIPQPTPPGFFDIPVSFDHYSDDKFGPVCGNIQSPTTTAPVDEEDVQKSEGAFTLDGSGCALAGLDIVILVDEGPTIPDKTWEADLIEPNFSLFELIPDGTGGWTAAPPFWSASPEDANYQVFAGSITPIWASGDTDCDGDIDTLDLTTAITNFTGAGGSGKGREDGDTDNDGDVDTVDLTSSITNFTGAMAGNANVPDLVYDPATGNVTIDADGADVISFSLQSGPFNAADFTELPAGLTDNIASQIGWTSFNLFSGLTGTADLGAILPAGLDLAGLEAALTTASYGLALAGGGGGGRLDLIIPEPATLGLLAIGLLFVQRRRCAA